MPDESERRPVADLFDLPSPCEVPWEEMGVRDGTVRFCERCQREVHDLSALTAAEATALLDSRPGVCVNFLVDDAGDMLTRAPAHGRPRRLPTLPFARSALSSLAGGVAGAALLAGCSNPSETSTSAATVQPPSAAIPGSGAPATPPSATPPPEPAAPPPSAVASSPPASATPAPSASVAECVHQPHRTGGAPRRTPPPRGSKGF